MSLPIAINGVGRIGRALIRHLASRDDLLLVAVNELAPVEQIAGLLRRDTFHGAFPGEIGTRPGSLVIDGRPVPFYSEPEISAIPWGEVGC